MRFVIFCHSLVSDWNHGNAHFLRGIAGELLARGHEIAVYEPRNGWSRSNLIAAHGEAAIRRFHEAYPDLESESYDEDELDLDRITDGADVVIVHEWNTSSLIRRIGRHRGRSARYRLLFHDTHHRSVSDPEGISKDLEQYDGVLAFGECIRQRYLASGWARTAWTWHEAADVRLFTPLNGREKEWDLAWIGNWGDEERTRELAEFLIKPVLRLRLRSRAYGVRYPEYAVQSLRTAGIEYFGWVPNHEVPGILASSRITVHIPRRPYVNALPGVPTIRVFEALACGIPLICSHWNDIEGLFTSGGDYLSAETGQEMENHLRAVTLDPQLAKELSIHGRRTILAKHTCSHRVDELLEIYRTIAPSAATVE